VAGTINLIYGEAETGKTTLATQCAANCAKQLHKTLFVDCDDTFSVERLSQITSKRFKETAENIVLVKPRNFREQATIIDQLTEYTSNNFTLTIFDTFTSLYRLMVSESPSKTFELNRELNRQLAVLSQTAKISKITLLMTSQVRSVIDQIPTIVEPVATRVLKFWANVIIALTPTENFQIVKMTLEKNPHKLQSKTHFLMIEKSGIHDYSDH